MLGGGDLGFYREIWEIGMAAIRVDRDPTEGFPAWQSPSFHIDFLRSAGTLLDLEE